MSPKVSIVIPTYNSEKFIDRTIKSVLNQTFQNFELIIVDDCSVDNTRKMIREFQKQDDRIKLIALEKNSGAPAHPKNVGIKNAKGEYIAFLDHDDEWLPEKLERQIELFKNSLKKNLGFVGCNIMRIDLDNRKSSLYKISKTKNGLGDILKDCFVFTSSSVVVARGIFKDVGFFDENFKTSDDWDMWIRIIKAGYAFDFVPNFLLRYYVHRDSIGGSATYLVRNRDLIILMSKYKNLYKKYIHAYDEQLRRIGHFYLLADRRTEARSYIKEAIKQDPFRFKAYVNLFLSFCSFNFYKKVISFKRKLCGQSRKV